MVVQKICVLSLLITQALSAPSGCIESCTYLKQYQSQASGIQDHSSLSQTAAHLQGPDYSRPGTWSEHNDYNVDNGHGKVHEERGQVVDGPKTVRYYKKNYSSSYGTGYSNGAGLSDIEQQSNSYRQGIFVPSTDELLNSQRTYSQIRNSESIAQQQNYNRVQSQQHGQSSLRRTNAQSERLEDLGEYGGNSYVTQQGVSDMNTQVSQGPYSTNTQSGNWSTVDSYKTDGGRGRVFEEEGQYVSGAKKVRYYKRNYTSSYSSSDGIPSIAGTGMQDIHKEIESLHREIGKGFSQISTTGYKGTSSIPQTHIDGHGFSSDNAHIVNSNYKVRDSYGTASSMAHHSGEHVADSTNEYVPHTNPSQSSYGKTSYSRYEGRVTKLQPSSQLINPTPGYTNVLSTGNSGYHQNIYSETALPQQMDSIQQTADFDAHQSKLVQNQAFLNNLRNNGYNQNSASYTSIPGKVTYYKEHRSSSHSKQTSVPQSSAALTEMNQHMAQYSNNQYEHKHSSQQAMQHQDSYLSQFGEGSIDPSRSTLLGKLITGTFDLNQGQDTVDCAYGAEHAHGRAQYQTKYKRNTHKEDEEKYNDSLEQISGKLVLDQDTQQTYQPWNPNSSGQQVEDLTQETGRFDDLTQQTSGKIEFGGDSQETYQPWNSHSATQNLEDLTQQTGGFDDLTQQTSGKLEFGQDSHPSWKPNSASQKLEDLNQQTGGFDDLTQQTSGKLEFGQDSQQSYEPWKPNSASQKLEDLTQQTGGFDDLTQQASGKLEIGQDSQQSYEPWKPNSAGQKLEDLTQQTGGFDDMTQQASGKLEFGQDSQQSYEPWKPNSAGQKLEDLTQQTGGFDDLTQQTSGKLEFGQDSHPSWKPNSANQKLEDLNQQTGFDDLTQQASGKLEFGQDSQQSYEPWKPNSANQKLEDLTQQTGGFDDLTQQTSGKLEFGEDLQPSQKPNSANQKLEDLNQQTGGFDDLTQQTSGKLEFGQDSQQSYEPWKPNSANQKLGDLTQQTGGFDDLTQQTSGKLEFGEDSQPSQKPNSANQKLEDLNQQTGGFDDLTQQTSGKLEFGQDSQQSWKPNSASQKLEDLNQQTGGFDDLTQQTSAKLEFGQDSQQSWKPNSASQKLEDLNQQTGGFDDLTQQTSGKLEFSQDSQQSYEPWKPNSASQKLEDLTQQTGGFEDLTQQTSGKLEFGQDSHPSWKPNSASQKLEDFAQQTGGFDVLTQQTSGKLEFGQDSQQTYQPWKPNSANQKLEDLNQQTGRFGDLTQQTSGKLDLDHDSQQTYQPWQPNSASQKLGDITHQRGDVPMQEVPILKPAEKPKPRSRYSRVGSSHNMQQLGVSTSSNSQTMKFDRADTGAPVIEVIPPDAHMGISEEQDSQSTDRTVDFRNLSHHTENSGYDTEGGNVDQVNWLHKSNDATVGLQWHYTYHPSDQRQFVQQIDQKDKNGIQQHTTEAKLLDIQQNTGQGDHRNLYQQPGIERPSQKFAPEEGVKTSRRKVYMQQATSRLPSNQPVSGATEDGQKNTRSSETVYHLEPRILEAYGGGEYDPHHSDDIYSRVRVNPSATLPPTGGVDPWYIREKPSGDIAEEATPPPLPVEPIDIENIFTTESTNTYNTETTTPSTVWSRLGHKITSTIDKARERARNIFG